MPETEAYPTQDYDDATYALNHPEDGPPEGKHAGYNGYSIHVDGSQSPAEPSQASPRTFYRSDYGRAARLIQAARHVPGDPYTAKPEAQLDAVSALAVTLATAFALDSPEHFDSGEFFTSTQLPVKPQASEVQELSAQTLYADGEDPDGYGPEEYDHSLAKEDERNAWQQSE